MEDVKILVSGSTSELIIRKGEASKVWDPQPTKIEGVINTVSRFLKNRIPIIDNTDDQGSFKCHILANKEDGGIHLIVDEHNHFNDEIKGIITVHPSIEKFSINSGEYILPEKMANFLKMRKHLFNSQSVYSSIYTALKTFKAKVNQEIDAIKDDRGNFEIKKAQVVEHNIPDKFDIKVPLFKGTQPVVIPVEFMVNSTLDVALSSTDLIQMIDQTREELIDKEIKDIQKIAPDIVIIYI